jgi:hypothetical protein
MALLSHPEADFTEAIARGMTLQEAAASAGEWDPAEMLRRYAGHGMLRAFSAGSSPGT